MLKSTALATTAVKLGAAAAATVALVTTAAAYAQPVTYFNHNGSLVLSQAMPNGEVQITYDDPRLSLRPLVVSGTLLIDGRWLNNQFSGVAYTFSGQCGATPYQVRGSWWSADNFVLEGYAPVLGHDCRVTGYEWNEDSHLEFHVVR